jgi:predicted RNA-binding Zn-ribbon protein involved in translation (DUF1610 family)
MRTRLASCNRPPAGMKSAARAVTLAGSIPERMPAETTVRTHCPNCGAKILRQDLSLCAYCATPLSLGGAISTEGDETAQRVARLREHPAFATAMAWTPRDPEDRRRAKGVRMLAWAMFFFGIAIFTFAVVQEGGFPSTATPIVFAGLSAATGILLLMLSRVVGKKGSGLPLLRRPCIVVVRRSETLERRGPGATVYFFTLHFDDGSEGEFRWPGQGTLYEPMPNGTTGIAYTRGDRLLEFRKL